MDDRYFDYAATSPARPVAIQAMVQAMECLIGNPSSPHIAGRNAQAALQRAKQDILDLLQCTDGQLVLCASASEATNLVLHHILELKPWMKIAIATDAHACVHAVRALYPDRFFELALSKNGLVEQEKLSSLLQEHSEIGLVCLNHVCHETGLIQDVQSLAAYCERREIACLVDGTQAVGHIPVHLDEIGADFYIFAAHKFGGISGCAGVVLKGASLKARTVGGRQEYGMRAGTENTAALIGTVHALTEAIDNLDSEQKLIISLKQLFIKELSSSVPALHFVSQERGDADAYVPNISACICPHVLAASVVELCSQAGFSVANGSACTADKREASPILLAMGYTEDESLACLRISFGPANTATSTRALSVTLAQVYAQLIKQVQ